MHLKVKSAAVAHGLDRGQGARVGKRSSKGDPRICEAEHLDGQEGHADGRDGEKVELWPFFEIRCQLDF